ncbi:MAG: DNA polymerase III subunit gamma/tau [Vampirovibrionales bacterium]
MTAIATYLPLYRRYRPQCFADVVGQQPIMQTLSNAITSGKVAHAYLFCGPRGTGKTSTARILAKSLNCAQGPTVSPCGQCPSCQGVVNGNALDVVEIDAASHNGVADARDLIETCQFAPMQGRYKIYIIDEVHMLSTQAFNALLKTLEEPPSHVVFILATTEAHKVLPTIISRCQRFDFSRITMADLKAHIAAIAQQESLRLTDEAILAIARHARGGLRDALSQLDQVGVLSRVDATYTITEMDVQRFLGALADDALCRLVLALLDSNVTELMQELEKLSASGAEPRQVLNALTQYVRQLMLARAMANAPEALSEVLGVPSSVVPLLVEQAQRLEPEEYPQWMTALSQIETQLRFNSQPQLWLEVGLVALAHREGMATVQQLSQRLAALEAQWAATGAASPVGVKNPPLAPPPLAKQVTQSVASPVVGPSTPVQQSSLPEAPHPPAAVSGGLDWAQLLAAVASGPVRAMLTQQAHLVTVEATQVVVAAHSEAILKTLQMPTKLIHLTKAVESLLGRALPVHLVVAKPTEALVPQAAEEKASLHVSQEAVLPITAPANHPPVEASSGSINTPETITSEAFSDALPPDWEEAKQQAAYLLQGTVI